MPSTSYLCHILILNFIFSNSSGFNLFLNSNKSTMDLTTLILLILV
jgi:hypothetical protein